MVLLNEIQNKNPWVYLWFSLSNSRIIYYGLRTARLAEIPICFFFLKKNRKNVFLIQEKKENKQKKAQINENCKWTIKELVGCRRKKGKDHQNINANTKLNVYYVHSINFIACLFCTPPVTTTSSLPNFCSIGVVLSGQYRVVIE